MSLSETSSQVGTEPRQRVTRSSIGNAGTVTDSSRQDDVTSTERSSSPSSMRQTRSCTNTPTPETTELSSPMTVETPVTAPLMKRTKMGVATNTLAPSRKLRSNKLNSDEESDLYCWICRRDGQVVVCALCPRVYHLKCLGMATQPDSDWICVECEKIMRSECEDTRPKSLQHLTLEQLTLALQYALERMKVPNSEVFQVPVDINMAPDYHKIILHPMDMSILEKNIKKKHYGSTEAFLADTKWILHNSIIYNGIQSRYTATCKSIIKTCRNQMMELETCPDCYLSACTQENGWFCKPCRRPHPLVWAKLKGYPFWPAKALREVDSQVDCRFFGAHDRAWVPASQVFMLSQEPPAPIKNKKGSGFDEAMAELEKHISKLKSKFGSFVYAASREPYRPDHDQAVVASDRKRKSTNLSARDGSAQPVSKRHTALSIESTSHSDSSMSRAVSTPEGSQHYSCVTRDEKLSPATDDQSQKISHEEGNGHKAQCKHSIKQEATEERKPPAQEEETKLSADFPCKPPADLLSKDKRAVFTISDDLLSAVSFPSIDDELSFDNSTTRMVDRLEEKMRTPCESFGTSMKASLSGGAEGEVSVNSPSEPPASSQTVSTCTTKEPSSPSMASRLVKSDVDICMNMPVLKEESRATTTNTQIINARIYSCHLSTNDANLSSCQSNHESPNSSHSSREAPPTSHSNCDAPPTCHSSCEAPPTCHSGHDAPPTCHSSCTAPPSLLHNATAPAFTSSSAVVGPQVNSLTFPMNISETSTEHLSLSHAVISARSPELCPLNPPTGKPDNPNSGSTPCEPQCGAPSKITLTLSSVNRDEFLQNLQKTIESCKTKLGIDTPQEEIIVEDDMEFEYSSSSDNHDQASQPEGSDDEPMEFMDSSPVPCESLLNKCMPEPPSPTPRSPSSRIASPSPASPCPASSGPTALYTDDGTMATPASIQRAAAVPESQDACSLMVRSQQEIVAQTTLSTNQVLMQPAQQQSHPEQPLKPPVMAVALAQTAKHVPTRIQQLLADQQHCGQPSAPSYKPSQHPLIQVPLLNPSQPPQQAKIILEPPQLRQGTQPPSSHTAVPQQLDSSVYVHKIMASVQSTIAELVSNLGPPYQPSPKSVALNGEFHPPPAEREMPSAVSEADQSLMREQVEKLKWKHKCEIDAIKHNAELSSLEMKKSIELEKERALWRLRKQLEFKYKKMVEDTKKKQWCALCGKEAIFYCCWNTSYCDYPCQQKHWPTHLKTCAQLQKDGQEVDGTKTALTVQTSQQPTASKILPTTSERGQQHSSHSSTVTFPPTTAIQTALQGGSSLTVTSQYHVLPQQGPPLQLQYMPVHSNPVYQTQVPIQTVTVQGNRGQGTTPLLYPIMQPPSAPQAQGFILSQRPPFRLAPKYSH